MSPDRGHPLSAAAARRHETALARARRALAALARTGEPVSFQAVARGAGVSRQWLYTQPGLRAEIERLRDQPRRAAAGVPARERASDASLRQRVEQLLADNHRLRAENADLKAELAIAYGQQRAAR